MAIGKWPRGLSDVTLTFHGEIEYNIRVLLDVGLDVELPFSEARGNDELRCRGSN